MIRVVCACLLDSEGKILLCQKAKGPLVGQWEFPGGKLEPNESLTDAINRELEEELSIIHVRNWTIGPSIIYHYPHVSILLTALISQQVVTDLKCNEHAAAVWVSRETVENYHLAAADALLWRNLSDNLLNEEVIQ